MDNIGALLEAYLDNTASRLEESKLFAAVECGALDKEIERRLEAELLAELIAEFDPEKRATLPSTNPARDRRYQIARFTSHDAMARNEANELISTHVQSGKIACIKTVAEGVVVGCRESYFIQRQSNPRTMSFAEPLIATFLAATIRESWRDDKPAARVIAQGSFPMATVVRPCPTTPDGYDVDELAAVIQVDYGVQVFVSVKFKDSFFLYSPEFTYTEVLDTVAKRYKVTCSPLGDAVCIIDDISTDNGVKIGDIEFLPVMEC